MSHPFGDLLHQHLQRKHGLTQSRLAKGTLQDPAIISNMCRARGLPGNKNKNELYPSSTGYIRTKALYSWDEANALLHGAGLVDLQANASDGATLPSVLFPQDKLSADQFDHTIGF